MHPTLCMLIMYIDKVSLMHAPLLSICTYFVTSFTVGARIYSNTITC